MKEKISAAAKLLLPALRQYQHNDGSGLLAGYDTEVAERIVAALMVSPAPSAEVEAVEAVARLLTWRGPKYQPVPHGGVCARHYAEYPENHYPDGPWAEGEPLMTVAQHLRIVAAKDAELKELRGSMAFRTSLIGRLEAERDELRELLARATLAPAAVVMPERRADDYPSPRTRDAYNAALDAVARLNRRAIPAGLLERIAVHLEKSTYAPFGDPITPEHAERARITDELRALLGKDGSQ